MIRPLLHGLLAASLLALAPSCTMAHTQFAEAGIIAGPADGLADAEGAGVVGHVYANAWGIYFMGKAPLVTGGLDAEDMPAWRWFEDSVEVETVVELLAAEARRRGATHIIDLETDWYSSWSAATVFFWTIETQASATALRVSGEAPDGAVPIDG